MSIRKAKLFTFLFPAFLFITIWNLIVIGWSSFSTVQEFNEKQTQENLQTQVHLFSKVIENVTDPVTLQRLAEESAMGSSVRFTVVDTDGRVIAESAGRPQSNRHLNQYPEIQEALKTGHGRDNRFSELSQSDMIYSSYFDPNQLYIVRAGITRKLVDQSENLYLNRIIIAGLISLFISLLLAYIASRRISTPISRLEDTARRFARREIRAIKEEQPWAEFDSLSDSLSLMASEIDQQILNLTLQKQETEVILASMTEGVLALDTDNNLLSANDSAQELLNFQNEPALNQPFFNTVHSKNLEELIARTQSQEDELREDFQLGSPEEERILEYRGKPLLGIEKQTIGTLVVLHDVTQNRLFERMRREFVGNVSHELRTPITSIQGFLETLMEGDIEDPKEAQHFMRIIDRQTKRLSSIIEDLLSLSRLDQMQSSTSIDKHWHRIHSLLTAVKDLCYQEARKKNITLEFQLDEHLELKINQGLFEQALVNLVNNAIRYSPEETQVSISFKEHQEGFRISVQDQGPGIALEHQERLFERFFRIDKARSRAAGGTGLGLAIVKHIARLHETNVGLNSQLGEGSCFYLNLPLKSVRNQI